MPLIMKFARQEDDELKEHVLQVAQQRFFLIIVKCKKLQDPDPSSTRKFNTGTGSFSVYRSDWTESELQLELDLAIWRWMKEQT